MALVGYTFVLLLTVILSQFEVIDSFARVDRNPMGMTFMALGVILLFSAFGLMIVYLVRLEGTLRIARQIRAAMKAVGIEDVRALLEESALPQRGASEQK